MTDEKRTCLSGKDLTKVFGFSRQRTVAVDHVDFDFHEGEVISIVGESGSGKTTLLAAISEAIPESERVITIDTHADIPSNFATAASDPGESEGRQVTLPKMRAGGLDAVTSAAVSRPSGAAPGGPG